MTPRYGIIYYTSLTNTNNMETLIDLRLQAIRIAASLKDVSSENVIDIADKIYIYIKKDSQIPESISMDELIMSIANAAVINVEKGFKREPPPIFDKDLVVCYD